MSDLLIFAGTTEGRELIEALSDGICGSELNVYACVATDYGKDLLPENSENINILSGRMTEAEMVPFMKEHKFDYVIDTTHPYAKVVSENIISACSQSGCEYIRLLRPSGIPKGIDANVSVGKSEQDNCMFFNNHEEVISYLNTTKGNVLLTIGSKELGKYKAVNNYQQRLFTRVLPMTDVLQSCYDLGFSGRQLICMQGPFSLDLNVALLSQLDAGYLVTKDSGEPGGFLEKFGAAQKAGAKLLVIGRDSEEEGTTLEKLLRFLENKYNISLKARENEDLGQWFPLFTNISGKQFTVIGAGKIAKRRIQALLKFDCKVKVVATDALPEVVALAEEKKLELNLKEYEGADLESADYVLAATNSKQINNEINIECKKNGIPVNVADDKEKSDFYFPGIIRKGGVTVGVTAEGKNHSLAKTATRKIADLMATGLKED